jgi:hypothetical protein
MDTRGGHFWHFWTGIPISPPHSRMPGINHLVSGVNQALRFQGVSSMLSADPAENAAPAPAMVDPTTQVAGKPIKYQLDVGESTPLSPAMQAVLCL